MARRRPRIQRVDGIEAVRLLASPVRMEILNSLAGVRRASIAELGKLLGRAPSSLYHHVAQLVEAGLILEGGRRPTGAHDELVYEAAADEIGLAHDPADAELSAAIADAMAANLRAAERDFRAALCEGTGRVRGRGKDTFGGRYKGWLEEADRRELFEHVEAIATIFGRRQGSTGGRLVTATIATCPAAVKRQRRER